MMARTIKKIFRKQTVNLMYPWSDGSKKKNLAEESLFGVHQEDVSVPSTNKRASKKNAEESKSTKTGKGNQKHEIDFAHCIANFLNLIFGIGPEAENFWERILKKNISEYYQVDSDDINLKDITIGGLLHAVLYHCCIDIKFEGDNFIKDLGTTTKPFKKQSFIGFRVESKLFQLRNVDVRLLSEKYQEYRLNNNLDLSVRACNIKLSIDKAASYKHESPGDPSVYADLAETLLELHEIDKAAEKASTSLKLCQPLHAERVKGYCVLIRVQMMRNQIEKAIEYFDEALKVLGFHLGFYHPLQSTVYSILAHFYTEKEMFQDALFLHKSSLVCCMRVLGPNHAYTGEVYMDLANVMLRMGQKEEALQNFEKAYLVFEAAKGVGCADCAVTSFQMANIQLGFGIIKH